jgi:peptidoglycan-associated lipoprotein
MRARPYVFVAVLLVIAVAVLPGCQKKKPAEPTPAPETTTSEPAQPPKPVEKKEVTESFPTQPVTQAPITEPSVDELNRQKVLRTVYFDYDKSDLTDATRQTLQSNAEWLKQNPKRKIVIEGHCDERGTIEYNLALGQRRAAAVRGYLESLGIDSARLRVVSYGKERPLDPGHTEDAWSRNRRAEFLIES